MGIFLFSCISNYLKLIKNVNVYPEIINQKRLLGIAVVIIRRPEVDLFHLHPTSSFSFAKTILKLS